jgi:Fic family protein
MDNQLTNKEPYRAGRYVRQPGSFDAFVPEPLRPGMLRMDSKLARLLSDADRAIGRLDGAAAIFPNPDLFVAAYSRKEALLSSQIEGTQASMVDVLEYEMQEPEGRPLPPDVQEVVNHQRAMHFGLERLEELPVSNRLLREIHGVLMRGVRGERRRPGEFRRSQNWIGPPGSTIQEATFVPPPVPETEQGMADLERYINEDSETPILLKCGLVHYQFETIHPFEDGNGRMGRLLITFMLGEQRVLARPLLYLSVFLKRNKPEYYRLLNHVRDTGDYEAWISFFLRGVREVSIEATETAQRVLKMREEHIARALSEVNSAYGPPFVDHLLGHGATTAKAAARGLAVSYPTANKLISEFERLGLLEEVTGRSRGRVFVYRPYLDELGGALPPDAR